MSTFNDIDIDCTNCGESFRGTIWVALHAGQNPELKELLLGGELNLVSCPQCGDVSFYEHFLIYQEPAAELIAYVYPESQRPREIELRQMMLSGFTEAQKAVPEKDRLAYEPEIVFGLESLIDMLRREEALAEQSQIAQVLCRQNQLDVTLLPPSRARRLQTMRVIPRVGISDPPTRDEIVAGIDQLLAIDPVLDRYAQLKATIQANPTWAL